MAQGLAGNTVFIVLAAGRTGQDHVGCGHAEDPWEGVLAAWVLLSAHATAWHL